MQIKKLKKKKKYFSFLQSAMLRKAASMLLAEKEEKKVERERVVDEKHPPLKLSSLSLQELQVVTKPMCFIYLDLPCTTWGQKVEGANPN